MREGPGGRGELSTARPGSEGERPGKREGPGRGAVEEEEGKEGRGEGLREREGWIAG